MYLKSIEVQGFKSFANKLVFEFHNGITCIVGPNGSGKSNVADAVRWVLGEQSAKQLRGSNMQDVIFSGTEARKPLGFASVSITLDNSDHKLNINYDEVTVTRKVFRSGESEYKLNGVNCRLRDIYELFYDTGIGKEGYSIIGQGQIERILSNKPEERRELFDEAVGIVKYKRRKQSTLKKLESEHANLTRVSDILSELEKQVGPLKRQSETAKKYLSIRDELKKYDLQLFRVFTNRSEEDLKKIEENDAIVCGDLEDTKKALDELTSAYEEVDTFIRSLDEQSSELSERMTQTLNDKNEIASKVLLLNEQIASEEKNRGTLNERLEQIRTQLLSMEEEKNGYLTQKTELIQTLEKQKEKEAELTAQMKALDESIAENMVLVEKDQDELKKLLNSKSDVVAKLQHFDTLYEQVSRRRSEISSKRLQSQSELETAQENRKTFADRLASVRDNVATYRKQFQETKEIQQGLVKKRDDIAAEKDRNIEQFHEASSRAASLKNLEEHFEGYQNSIRKIMEYKQNGPKNLSGIEGVVSDLLEVDKKYETAIEIALGGSIQNIVTRDTDTAKTCIAYLKQNKFGRATFLPMDAVKKNEGLSRPEALKEKGVLGTANTLIRFEKKYTEIFDQLLGRVVVCDNMENATALSVKYKQSLRIVTLEGELFTPGGAITGGAYKNNSNLLGRKREITEWEEQAALRKKMVDQAEQKLKKANDELAEINKKGQEIVDKMQQVALSETTISLSLKQCDDKIEVLKAEIADSDSAFNELCNQLDSIRAEKEQIEAEINAIERQNADNEQTVQDYAKRLENDRKTREEIASELSDLKASYAKEEQTLNFLSENAERIRRDSENLTYEAENLMQRVDESEQSAKGRQHEIEQGKETIGQMEEALAKLKEEQAGINEKKNKVMSEQKDFFSKQTEISDRKNELEMERLRLESRREKIEERLTEMTEYLFSEYEMTPTQVPPLSEEITDRESELHKIINQFRSQIKGLGHVNVGAIEEYKEVSERYEFMKTQHEDLTKSEAALHKIIEELDEGMRKQFNEQFALIQVEFDKVFKELFGGGHARLELVEDQDVIEAGIRIISQPPGKKLQNMMQLSGGEKALTAISLLFAIQSLKPSPFCLLDEIEAALDDSNVGRFAEYLHKLTEHTQFILISHRRGTMVSADRLYGITMQEKGVSALVSVNLIENELDN